LLNNKDGGYDDDDDDDNNNNNNNIQFSLTSSHLLSAYVCTSIGIYT
jgi:hypothetical protein